MEPSVTIAHFTAPGCLSYPQAPATRSPLHTYTIPCLMTGTQREPTLAMACGMLLLKLPSPLSTLLIGKALDLHR